MNQTEIRNIPGKGKGLYSLVHFDNNQVILKFKNKIINEIEADQLNKDKQATLLQVGKNKYLDLIGDPSFYVNHSCNPNAIVKIFSNNAFLVSIRRILPNEELCFDYSLTSTDSLEDWSMKCSCGAWNCRKLISGFNLLNDSNKQRYINMNVVPKYNK